MQVVPDQQHLVVGAAPERAQHRAAGCDLVTLAEPPALRAAHAHRRKRIISEPTSGDIGIHTEAMAGSTAYTPAALKFSRPPDEIAGRDSVELLERMRRGARRASSQLTRCHPSCDPDALRTAGTAPLHIAGLATLTHAPSPTGFRKEILGRPENERPFLLLPVGYPTEGASVPALDKKPLEAIATFE